MSVETHKSKPLLLLSTFMKEIDHLPLHPKNKVLVYNRYALSKVLWHFAVTELPQTRVMGNLDNLAFTDGLTFLSVQHC